MATADLTSSARGELISAPTRQKAAENRLRLRNLVAAFLILFGLVLSCQTVSIAAQHNNTPYCNDPSCSEPIAGTAYQYPESHIRITKVVFFTFESGPVTAAIPYQAGCVDFFNDGPQVVSSVTFQFWPRAVNGRLWTPMVVKGPFAVGVLQYRNAYVMPVPDYTKPLILSQCGVDWGDSAFVLSVTYADGTVWKAPADAPTGAIPEMTSAAPPSPAPS